MPTYETVIILKPTLSDTQVTELTEKTKKDIASGGGEMLSQEVWGRRRLSHPIDKARDGVYAYFKYKSESALMPKLNHSLAIAEAVLRHMTVVAQDRKLKEKIKKKKAETAAPKTP